MRYLTKHDLEQRFYGIEQYRPGDSSTKDLHLAASSGTTTGLPTLLVVYRPILERDDAYREWLAPVRGTVRLARNYHMALQIMYRALMTETTDRMMVLDERDMAKENLPSIMFNYEPETVNGPPSRILLWAERLAEAGMEAMRERVRLVQIFGELLTPPHRALLKKAFPRATFRNGYMFSGANYPTIECPASNEDRHHLLKGKSVTRLSIIEPDENGIGEIVATTHELKKYRTGDLGKLDLAPCPCGESPILTLHGRKDFDRIPILGATFLKGELERVLEPFADRLADYQLRVGEGLRGTKLIGRAEFDFVPRSGATIPAEEITEHLVRTLFVTKTRTFSDIISVGIFAPLTARHVSKIQHGKKHIPLKRVDFKL